MELGGLLEGALSSGHDGSLRAALEEGSGLPGPRLDLGLVDRFADAVAAVATREDPPVAALERLLDGWAALDLDEAPGDRPAVVLPCGAVAAYGAVGVARPDWWDDEVAKLRRAAADPRWRVREIVARALQRLLVADWWRVAGTLEGWAVDDDPLVVRAAAAAVAQPGLLHEPDRAAWADGLQAAAVARYRREPPPRRCEASRTLRQTLGSTLSVTAAATGRLALLEHLATSGDADLRWIVGQNLRRARLARWPDEVARIRAQLNPEA